MRIELQRPLDLESAFQKLNQMAEAAHADHGNAGGYSFNYAAYWAIMGSHPDQAGIKASLSRHMAIEEARRAAAASIRSARHGNAISNAISEFEKRITV